MYRFSEDLIHSALEWYTILWCGEYDVDFFYELSYDTFNDVALEACIVMDYIDGVCEDIYEENIRLEKRQDQYKEPLDGWNGLGRKGFEG